LHLLGPTSVGPFKMTLKNQKTRERVALATLLPG
jgi:hypothetical protein